MEPYMKRTPAGLSLAALALCLPLPVSAAASYDDIAPVLAERCVMCHSGAAAAAGLHLDTLQGVLAGSQKGKVVKPGDAAASELIRRLKGSSQPRMPMTGPPFLTDAEVVRFEQWIDGGLAPGKTTAAPPPPLPVPKRPAAGEPVTYAHVAPLFAQRCAKCHTDSGLTGPAPEGYRLTSHAATLSPADRVRVVPGRPEASELLRRIKGHARPRMPLDGPPYLSDADIQLVESWIAQGARDASGTPARIPAGARVRLHGVLGADGKLDGLDLDSLDATRQDKLPRPGDYARLEGRLDDQGKVVVERLRRR
jgi:mono/diheme cytochrome c family protein